MIENFGFKIKSKSQVLEKIDNLFKQYATLVISIVTAIYILFFSLVGFFRYQAFDFNDFDLAVHSQTVWNILQGSIESSILGIPFLGNHLNLILFLIAPIFALFSTPLTLIFLQTLFIGLGVVPLYLLARDILDRNFALAFSLAYLIYPALHFVNYFEFHPVAFAIFFILFMIFYFEKEKFIPFLCFMFLSLLCKENLSLGIFFFGLYVLFFRKRQCKWSLAPILTAVVWLIIGLKMMKIFNPDTINFNYLYSHTGDSMPRVFINILSHPLVALKLIFTGSNIKFSFQLFFPLAFLSLLSPKILFISLPFFLQQFLSLRSPYHTIYYHYTAKLIPFIFVSSIYGTKWLLKLEPISRYRRFLPLLILFTSIAANISFGLMRDLFTRLPYHCMKQEIDYRKQKYIDQMPKDASVVATFEFLPKLAPRKKVFSFHHVYMGKYTLSRKEYVLPNDTEYALIDFNDNFTFTAFYRPDQYKNLQKFFRKNRWGLLAVADNIGLFKKGYRSYLNLYEILDKVNPLSSAKLLIENNIAIWGYNIEKKKIGPGQTIELSFLWECLRPAHKDYWLVFKVVDEEGKILHGYDHPVCYRIYPTYAWKKGDIIKENIWIAISSKIKAETVWLKMSIFDKNMIGPQGRAKSVSVEANIEGIFDGEGRISLGKIEIRNTD